MNKNIICWFEIYVKDIERAKGFYQEVLNIEFDQSIDAPGDAPDQMKMAFFSSPENQGVNGALVQAEGTKNGDGSGVTTMVYFPCDDCSVEASRVEKAGGVVQNPKMNLGEYGFCAICVDTEGNPFGLFSMQ